MVWRRRCQQADSQALREAGRAKRGASERQGQVMSPPASQPNELRRSFASAGALGVGCVRLFRPLLVASLLTCLAGCSDGVPTPPTVPNPPGPESANRSYVVSGVVYEMADGVSRPRAGQLVVLYITQDRTTRVLRVNTDQNGRYTAEVPRSRVIAFAWGALQPCIASTFVDIDATLDVQVFSSWRSLTRPTAGRMISGVVYEATPRGRVPLRGASIWLDAAQESYVAYTETDESGRFFLCRVDLPVRMDVFADGYEPYQYGEFIDGTRDTFFEFEFRR